MRRQFSKDLVAVFAVLLLAALTGLGACTQVKTEAPPVEEPGPAPQASSAAKSNAPPLQALPEGISGCPGFGPEDAPLKLVAFVDDGSGLAEHANLLLAGLAGGYSGSMRVHVCELPLGKTAKPSETAVVTPAPEPDPKATDEEGQAEQRQSKARERAAARRKAAAMRERLVRNKTRETDRKAPSGEEAPPACDGGCGDEGGCGNKDAAAGRAPHAGREKADKWKPIILRSEDMEKLPTEAKGIAGCATHGAFGPKVTILAFLDLASPDRGKAAETLAALEAAGEGEVATVVCVTFERGNKLSNAAARTVVAAHNQGKLAPYRAALERVSGEVNAAVFLQAATDAGLDIARWKKDVSAKETWAAVKRQSDLAGWLSVSKAPYLFINGAGIDATEPGARVRKLFDKQLGYGKRMQSGGAPAEVMHAAMSRSAMKGKYMKYVIWGLTPADPDPHPLYGLERPVQ